jgi:hypothetical protein
MTLIYRDTVPETRRAAQASALFGLNFSLRLEPCVFSMASQLSQGYRGGYWHFYVLSNGGFYMAPQSDALFAVRCENGFQGQLSADALGITACMYAYSHLSFASEGDFAETCAEHYHLLRDHVMGHCEARQILASTD